MYFKPNEFKHSDWRTPKHPNKYLSCYIRDQKLLMSVQSSTFLKHKDASSWGGKEGNDHRLNGKTVKKKKDCHCSLGLFWSFWAETTQRGVEGKQEFLSVRSPQEKLEREREIMDQSPQVQSTLMVISLRGNLTWTGLPPLISPLLNEVNDPHLN